MHAELVAIGNELLLGDTVNSNAARIGQALSRVGIACTRHNVVGDEHATIVETVREALERAPIVIVCGGLGPTEDDLTREAVAAALDRPLVRDASIVQALRDRFAALDRTMPERNLVQADVIEGARVIEPTWGTAPGMLIEHEDAVCYLLPGVPDELDDMLERGVLPDLEQRAGAGRIVSRTLHVVGVPESEIAERLAEVFGGLPAAVAMAYLPSRGEVRVKLSARGRDEASAAALIEPHARQVEHLLGPAIVGSDAEDLDAAVAKRLLARGWMLAAAESLTGGAFGARCTSRPGASDWFVGGIVAYRTREKIDLLGVPEALIDAHGVVSVEVAVAMAEGARRRLGAEVGVALTGVAGPSEHDGRPVGTVCLAVSGPGIEEFRETRLPGDRERIRQFAVAAAMILLARAVGR